ncbi:hypothetical protein DTO280E4_479 [Paecilomyces variotii]|nr:hypothetical protein DTO195F2_7888 [Paecilomyces variotii]KAJ9365510.1 hypothetical protein DTO280E4_479 [Paecilomyces variotii]
MKRWKPEAPAVAAAVAGCGLAARVAALSARSTRAELIRARPAPPSTSRTIVFTWVNPIISTPTLFPLPFSFQLRPSRLQAIPPAIMYRSAAARSLFRAAASSNASVARSTLPRSVFKAQLTSSARQSVRLTSPSLALAARKPVTTALVRYATTSTNAERDEPVAEEDTDVMAGMKAEAKVIKDTFSLHDVPKEALYLGMAGVVPYLVTSIDTAYLAWEINNAAETGDGVFISGQTAELMLHMLEPIQVGYGAVILSFLGAIHWGLEWAGYGGKQGYRRYAAGVVAPAVAWPTLLLPVDYALITQFLAFNFLYYNDARAAARGAAPHWYGMYRFVLTFVVGASIVLSLIGRERISQTLTSEHSIKDKINALLYLQQKEKEEKEARLREEAGAEKDEE